MMTIKEKAAAERAHQAKVKLVAKYCPDEIVTIQTAAQTLNGLGEQTSLIMSLIESLALEREQVAILIAPIHEEPMQNGFAKLFGVIRNGVIYQLLATKDYDSDTEKSQVTFRIDIKGALAENTFSFKDEELRNKFFDLIDQDTAQRFVDDEKFGDIIDFMAAETE